jgi:NitT/TauT family transport system substrate-binding protein
MNRIRYALFIAVAVLVVTIAACAPAASPTPAMTKLNLGYSTWVGYGPLFIARDKGYFKDEGLDVTLTKVEDPKDRFTALAGKQLDGLVTTIDTLVQYWKAETPFKFILGLDDSSGGDGIIAKPEINSVKDLKGKKIGVNVGSVSHYFLDYEFQQNGLSDNDVTLIKMKQGDVPAAFATGNIDAGVTWEPHLSKAVKGGAKLLITSKETPGLIVDVLVLRGDVIQANPNAAKALVRAWNKSIDYWKSNAEDADTVMAKGLAGFYNTADDIKADLAGATLYDAARNKQFFSGTGAGTAVGTTKFAVDLWTKLGIVTTPIKPEDLSDASFVNQ